MNKRWTTAVALATAFLAMQAMAQVTFYERENFKGRSFTTQQDVRNMQRKGFSDRASSVMVAGQPWQRWEVCDAPRFEGRCAVLRTGGYPSLAAMGLNNQVSSVRVVNRNMRVDDGRYAPAEPLYDARRRGNEHLFQANVTSVRAVVGPPEQRCWVEREQVQQEPSRTNVPATIAGAVIGGILGHQVGNGRGQDLATVGGAIAGGAVGASVGRRGAGGDQATRDVQRCHTVPSQAQPASWDVSYEFRGQQHRVQMSSPPGATITVNRQGEPRV
ncbi:MAG: beta/gamma crystallin-related protein [Burkholderiaceae bacterium]